MNVKERGFGARPRSVGRRSSALVPVMMVSATSVGWAYFCPDRLAAGGTSLVLVAEELVMDDEPGEGAVVGIYTSSSGGTLTIACPSEQADYDSTGASA